MGGGFVTRPDFHLGGTAPNDPMAEFYLALQTALSRTGCFSLPGAYVRFSPPPYTMLYAEDLPGCCELRADAHPGFAEILPAGQLRVLYDDLRVVNGTPSALVLTGEGDRRTVAVRLLPPVVFPGASLPALPDCTAALTVQLFDRDLPLLDRDPTAFGRAVCSRTDGKMWVNHPAIDRWQTKALAAAQRAYRKGL